MRPLALVATSAVALAAFVPTLGCSKSPQRVCDHLVDMAEKQFGDLDDAGAGMREKAVQTCVQEKSGWKSSNAKTFDCFADCVLDVRTLAEAADCEPKCGIPPKRHGEDEPEPDGVPGLWTDPYADAMHEDAPESAKNEETGEGTGDASAKASGNALGDASAATGDANAKATSGEAKNAGNAASATNSNVNSNTNANANAGAKDGNVDAKSETAKANANGNGTDEGKTKANAGVKGDAK